MRLLAGDIGGTKTWLALYEQREDGAREEIRQARYPSGDWANLAPMVLDFLGDETVRGAGFGIAGPVTERRVKLTNLPWELDADALERDLGAPVRFVNDFQAVALGLDRLGPADHHVLQEGPVDPRGPMVLLGAGTGLGEAVRVPTSEGPVILASEGGHTDFSPRNELEFALLRWTREQLGGRRVSTERAVSGLGLERIYRFLVATERATSAVNERVEADGGAAISAAYGEDDAATQALELFVSLYGAEAGNLALKVIPKGGLYVAGGIAPKLHATLGDRFRELFLEAYLTKGRMSSVLEQTQVALVLQPQVGLWGALAALDPC